MELVAEVYKFLSENMLDWPEYALCVMRDADGEIKFSSKTYDSIAFDSNVGIYSRGVGCMFNDGLAKTLPEISGTTLSPEIISVEEYEEYYYARK